MIYKVWLYFILLVGKGRSYPSPVWILPATGTCKQRERGILIEKYCVKRSSEVAACYLSPRLPVGGGGERLMSLCLIKSVDLTFGAGEQRGRQKGAAYYLPPCLPVGGRGGDIYV